MPRAPRSTVEGVAYHLLNRRIMRLCLFEKPADYEAFERILAAALTRRDAPALLGYCLMPNHWHLAVLPRASSNLSTWMQWLTVTHTHRWRQHYQNVGEGPLYQGRFKSFPIEQDHHLLMVLRYVHANPLRAGLVERAEQWRWGSLWVESQGSEDQRAMLSDWPVERPDNWLSLVNQPQEELEIERVRQCLTRGAPFGDDIWIKRIARTLGLQTTLRTRGRPKRPSLLRK